MTPAQTSHDYREFLKVELEQRISANARYSLRAFARDLAVSPSRLSHILNGKFGLSRSAAESLATRLGLSQSEAHHFCDLVESQHARSKVQRSLATQRVVARAASVSELSGDAFRAISDWYHFAIVEHFATSKPTSDVATIAAKFGISSFQVEGTLDRLIRLGLIQKSKTGRITRTGAGLQVPGGVPSDAIKRFHEQVLQKAIVSLKTHSLESRDISNVMFAVAEADLPLAKKRIQDFRLKLDQELSRSKKKNRVYNLSIQLFPLDTI